MKTIIELGYYHPSNANWNYRIHLILDESGARLYKETFGGDSRLIRSMEERGMKLEKLHAGRGSEVQYRWKDIKDLPDVESYSGKNW